MSLTPQLEPTNVAALEQVEDRETREQLFVENSIYVHEEPAGTRYTKGNNRKSKRRSWQSLDAILRSDANSSAALPYKQLRRSRVFTALTVLSSMLVVAGAAASAREGLDLNKISGGGGLLITGGVLTIVSGIAAGVTYNRARKGYARAVDVYNDSLGLRLGVLTPDGRWRPPSDVVVDSEGFVVLEDNEVLEEYRPGGGPARAPVNPNSVPVHQGQPMPAQPASSSAPPASMPPAARPAAAQPAQPRAQPVQPAPAPAAQPVTQPRAQPVQPAPRTQPPATSIPQPPATSIP
ncbi:MAG: hypothetical protein ACPG77_11850, partial [Nannocystaceae bacterium]